MVNARIYELIIIKMQLWTINFHLNLDLQYMQCTWKRRQSFGNGTTANGSKPERMDHSKAERKRRKFTVIHTLAKVCTLK